MVNLAIVVGGAIDTYPATVAQCRAHVGNISFGDQALTVGDLSALGIVRVAETTPPSITEAQRLVEATPILVGDTWTQQWTVVDLDAGEITAKLAAARDEVREYANRAMGTYSEIQRAAIAEVTAAQNDASPSQAEYPVVYGYAAGAGLTVGAVVTAVQGWRGDLAAVAQAFGAAMKELDDNGVAGIPAARAIMEAL